MGSTERKTKFLGVPSSQAHRKLWKSILFMLVQGCERDNCFRCGSKIETMDDLSIEHKLPWLGISIDLFWDLNNIAFSHLKCNMPHRRPGRPGIPPTNKKVGPPGTAWCMIHKDFLPIEKFSLNRVNWDGVQHICLECRSRLRK